MSAALVGLTIPNWQRIAAGGLIVAYLGTTFFYLGAYSLGDVGSHPLAYFFVWDMFPSHASESFRRVAVGQTASGKRLQLVPSGLQQFREGVHGDRTRADLERSGANFRTIAERIVDLTAAGLAEDPVVELSLYEEYWPAKFNYPDDLYKRWAGSPKPERRYWRLREQVPIEAVVSRSTSMKGEP